MSTVIRGLIMRKHLSYFSVVSLILFLVFFGGPRSAFAETVFCQNHSGLFSRCLAKFVLDVANCYIQPRAVQENCFDQVTNNLKQCLMPKPNTPCPLPGDSSRPVPLPQPWTGEEQNLMAEVLESLRQILARKDTPIVEQQASGSEDFDG